MGKKVYAIKKVLYDNGIDPETIEQLTPGLIVDPIFYNGQFKGEDYTDVFKVIVSRFLSMQPVPPLKDRIEAIEVLTEAYINQTGEVPQGVQLNLLGNWLLYEVLSNPCPDKVTNEEYPVMNKRQLKLRHRREYADKYIETRSETNIAKKKNTNNPPE